MVEGTAWASSSRVLSSGVIESFCVINSSLKQMTALLIWEQDVAGSKAAARLGHCLHPGVRGGILVWVLVMWVNLLRLCCAREYGLSSTLKLILAYYLHFVFFWWFAHGHLGWKVNHLPLCNKIKWLFALTGMSSGLALKSCPDSLTLCVNIIFAAPVLERNCVAVI